jgi:tRNA (guanine-N7-)-methyltransferase
MFGELADNPQYSGCGTARSSLILGNMYPDHLVIGIDRSLARLWRNVKFRKGDHHNSSSTVEEEFQKGNGNDICDGNVPAVQRASSNVILVRAELVDFWRLCAREEWKISKHYLLYPNPYPKKSRLKSRWYAHAAFPILLGLGGDIVVRSNWKGYLKEFAICTNVANECMDLAYVPLGPTRRCGTNAFTNFEQKYDNVGEPTYELTLSEGI